VKKNEIKVGGVYVAKVSGRLVSVRVDRIREASSSGSITDRRGRVKPLITVFDVTNLLTGRMTTFRSAARFREEVGKRYGGRRDAQTDGADTTAAEVEEESRRLPYPPEWANYGTVDNPRFF
jgi:hypothetical protein